MSDDLTEAVLAYQRTGENWRELSERIYLNAYKYPVNFTNWDYDKCCDFFVAFMPKIPGLVLRFKPLHTFESYLFSSLQWYMKTFTEQLALKEHYEVWSENESSTAMMDMVEENPVQEGIYASAEVDPLSNCPLKIDAEGRIEIESIRNRILFAVLTYVDDIDPVKIPAIARLTCVDPLWLENSLEIARKSIFEKTTRRTKLRNRRNECWYNMIRIQNRMKKDTHLDSIQIERWKNRYKYWEKRYKLASNALSRLSVRLSAADAGRILNIPQSTIASGLKSLRRYWINNEVKR